MVKFGVSWRFRILDWARKKVDCWAKERERAIVEAQTGNTRKNVFSSSICVTLHSFHRSDTSSNSVSSITAALSKNLKTKEFDHVISQKNGWLFSKP